MKAQNQSTFLERYKSAYQNEWTAFVTAVKTKTPMPVSLSDGIAALAIAEAAAASADGLRGRDSKLSMSKENAELIEAKITDIWIAV